MGWWLAIAHLAFGLLLCLTVIGIPMGIASFRMAALALLAIRSIVERSLLRELPEGAHTVR